MLGYYVLATLVTLVMALVLGVGVGRWKHLDGGAHLVTLGVGTFLALALVSMALALLNRPTRLVQEGPILVGTLLIVAGFSRWQATRGQRVVAIGLGVLFGVSWGLAQWLQGTAPLFSEISGPLHSVTLCAVAGFTLVGQVRVSVERWTDELWFWVSVGVMVIYGTEVVLDPLMADMFGSRDDLVKVAYYFHQLASALGWLLVARGLWRGRPLERRIGAGAPWFRSDLLA